MSLLDVTDLTEILKDRLGVSGMPVMGMGGGGGMPAAAPEGAAGDGVPPSTPPCRLHCPLNALRAQRIPGRRFR